SEQTEPPSRGLSAQRCRPAVDGGEGSARILEPPLGGSRRLALAPALFLRRCAMADKFYFGINLHLPWPGKNASPLLTPQVEKIVQHYLRGRCINEPGIFIHEIGGTETHVHLAVSVPPTIQPSTWVGQLKGSSSHEANQKLGYKALEWQTG